MKIVDLTAEHENSFFLCLEEWSEDIRESGNQRQCWYRQMIDKGLRVKIALSDEGILAGFIQYLPVSESILLGEDGYFICCIWVHGHKLGRGNLQRKGYGKALLEAAEQDARQLGANGIAAWGLVLPMWMKASWFRKYGFKTVDRDGISALVWKPFNPNAKPPKWRRPLKQPPTVKGKLSISIFSNGWCAALNISAERIKRIAEIYPEQVVLQEYNTRNKAIMDEWGISDAIYLNHKQVRTGPPPTYDKLKKLVEKMLTKM